MYVDLISTYVDIGFTYLVFKTTYIDGGKPLQEGAFVFTRIALFLRGIKGIRAIKRRACVSLRRGISWD